MSISRRQFLLSTAGASVGAIVPDFYFQALQFFEQFGEPMLEPPERSLRNLYVYCDYVDKPELCLGHPYESPPVLSFREFFTRYEPEGLETFEHDWDLGQEELDEPVPEEWFFEYWIMHDSPSARAHFYLKSLDLGPELSGPDSVGELELFQDWNMLHSWLGVRYEDEVTLSLLQKRLNDLGTGVRVVTDWDT